MKIAAIETFAISIPRESGQKAGGAGSPAAVQDPSQRYSMAKTYETVYATRVETTLVKITAADGMYGWGEAQAPILPEVTKTIIDNLLAPLLLDSEITAPLKVRDFLYNAMRVRGHAGGFYVDALSAVDCALWDLLGKRCGQPVCVLLGGPLRKQLPTYISGLSGSTLDEQLEECQRNLSEGAQAFKVFLSSTTADCLHLVEEIRRLSSSVPIFVDALWRLSLFEAIEFAQELHAFRVGFLEAPLAPEDNEGHALLALRSPIAIALGESYRTASEFRSLIESRSMEVVQPDIGRSGITGGMQIGALAAAANLRMAPHISIGMGPQIAAALHVSACWPHLDLVECNPRIYALANSFLKVPVRFTPASVALPDLPGLGVDLDELELRKFSVKMDRYEGVEGGFRD
jgi:D-galactarolactone cycloisomerase